MNESTHNAQPPINSLVRDNTPDALSAIHCSLRFMLDYVYLTVSRPDSPPNSAIIGFFYMLNLITEAVEYEIERLDPECDKMERQKIVGSRLDATEKATKGD